MLSKAQQDYLAKSVMPMQIIVGALAAGVLTFFVIVLIVSREGVPSEPFLTYIALGFAVLAFVGWVVVPHLVASQPGNPLLRVVRRTRLLRPSYPLKLEPSGS